MQQSGRVSGPEMRKEGAQFGGAWGGAPGAQGKGVGERVEARLGAPGGATWNNGPRCRRRSVVPAHKA